MNPRSLWTLLWGRGSFVSCTVCTFTLNLQWRQPHSSTREAAYGDPQSTEMSFLGQAETEERPPEKRLQFRVAVMEKRLQFRHQHQHQHQHQHILDSTSIRHWTTGSKPLCLKGKGQSTLPLRLSSGSHHCHGEASPISIPTPTLTPTHTRLLEHPPPYNSLWALAFKEKWQLTLPLRWSSGS